MKLTNIAFLATSSGFGVSLSTDGASYYEANVGSGTISKNTSSITSTVIGGTPSYTYSWTKISGDSKISANSSTSSSTSFNFNGTVGAGGLFTADYRLFVTDSATRITNSVLVTVTFELYPSDPP